MSSLELKKFVWPGALLIPLAPIAVLFACDPATVPIYPVCVFHRVTGLDCPGCGGLRAMHQLLHGNFIAALHFNAFAVLSVPLCVGLAARGFLRQQRGECGLGIRPVWYWIYFAAFLAFGILRDLPVPFLAAFAP